VLGYLTGLSDSGIDILAADLFVGTSAGAIVAAQVTSTVSIKHIAITAVDAETGDMRVFDIVDALAASTAIPGVWPPATINGRRYIDGGVRTMENADLAVGYDCVLILQAMPVPGVDTLAAEIATLRKHGSTVYATKPDEKSRMAIGPNPLDPEVLRATALAAYDQGREEAPAVARLWSH
jgi:NTE family protein